MPTLLSTILAGVLSLQPFGTVRGVVLDRADGSPIEDVSVRIQDGGAAVTTGADGRFELTNVAPGPHTLYVSLVGFILVKRAVDVAPGATVDVTIVLSEGTGTYSETVNVSGERFREQEKSVPAQQVLGSADIQNLRNLLTNDPMRAIQVLPGVTTGDDFRSEFAVRGSPFTRMNFTFDGIPTSFLLHTTQQVQNGGSIAMVNGDVLDGITLLNGSYPENYGNRLGAELDFHMREGSRDRTQVRVGISGTDASVVAEGPLGRNKAGSWLLSARKSYLELLLRQITEGDDDFGFGFSDTQAKLVYDATPRHHVELGVVAGHSGLTQTSPPEDFNAVDDGTNRAALVDGAWRFTPSARASITQRVAFAANRFENRNPTGFELGRGSGSDMTWRTDAEATLTGATSIQAGAQVQRQHRDETALGSITGQETFLVVQHDASATLASAYGQVRWHAARAALTAGARVDHWSLTGETAPSPWLQGELRLRGSLKLRGGTGIYRQFPGFEEAAGLYSSASDGEPIHHERAYHADLGLEQSIGSTARWQLTVYNREERDVLRSPLGDPRLINGRLVLGPIDDVWTNALDGYARGVELLVQRRSNSGLSGWVSYSYGVNHYVDRVHDEAFDGDFDQRHTFNAYGLYRITNRLSLSGKLRMGSNTPAIGYWVQRGDDYFVGALEDGRNTLRVPTYARLDLRANRTFNWERKRLTLFVEVMNVLGHDNVRYEQPFINVRTRQAFGIFSSMIPLVPSAGILIEF